MREIDNVVVVGAGIMGLGIAQVFAQGGKNVVLIDPFPAAIAAASGKIKNNVELLMAEGLLDVVSSTEIINRIQFAADISQAKDADLVIEAIPEKIELKETLFKELESACSNDTIIASNTSGIPITKLAGMIHHPERVIGTHFFNPAHLIPLVEVTQTESTDAGVIQQILDLLKAVGKQPVHVRKDIPGFIGNRLQHALAREAMSLMEQGVASAEDIDAVVKTSLAIRLVFTGPIEQRDFNGLDTHLSIAEYLYPELESASTPLTILREKVAVGELGLKSGRGFYDWTGKSASEVNGNKNQSLIDLLKFLKETEKE